MLVEKETKEQEETDDETGDGKVVSGDSFRRTAGHPPFSDDEEKNQEEETPI